MIRAAAALALVIAPAAGAVAQSGWVPGTEIVGQTLQVQTNGVTNTITLNADGTATIMTPDGQAMPGTWSAANNQLCMSVGGPQECWPYAQAFQAGRQIALTSNCNQVSTWMASATNQPPQQQPMGERG
ncbi:MAG: hypothetical protein M3438_01565 [Pseudomonadota bacterium]|nr:hypothetical protein [Pseudomonadota bacterium]